MPSRYAVLLSGCILALFFLSEIGHAADRGRRDKWEIFIAGRYTTEDTTRGLGITTEVENFPSFGFGLGYNFHEHFNVNWEMFFGSTDIIGRIGSQRVEIDTDVWIVNLNLDCLLLNAPVTPLVTAGIGFINFRGKDDSFKETDFSYNAGAGLRWNITNRVFFKAVYGMLWTKLEDSDSTLLFHGPSVTVGFSY